MLKEYDRMVKEYGLIVIDARESISTMQRQVRLMAQKELGLPSMGTE